MLSHVLPCIRGARHIGRGRVCRLIQSERIAQGDNGLRPRADPAKWQMQHGELCYRQGLGARYTHGECGYVGAKVYDEIGGTTSTFQLERLPRQLFNKS